MSKILSIDDLVNEIGVEFERFSRYNTPLTVVCFNVSLVNKEMQVNFLHKVVIELRNHLEKIIRKTDSLGRHRNNLIVILRNLDMENSKGFINRVFTSIDDFIKKNYKDNIDNEEMILVDVIINVFMISFCDASFSEVEGVLLRNRFDRKEIIELFENIDKEKVFETWELRLPILDRI
ncbi:MAG: hypothetical protein RMJ36_03715 [Candidatus Calescibacterium sp.]|nr:hypothetical protein [Candidatus Calescibacterium sp.]MDW8132744.1 hypothetical protein [Candidatus Calescibacterium sp.]